MRKVKSGHSITMDIPLFLPAVSPLSCRGEEKRVSLPLTESVPIVKERDTQAHSACRTQEATLSIHDAMAEAIRTGRPYQTRLDPPPALRPMQRATSFRWISGTRLSGRRTAIPLLAYLTRNPK